MDFPKGVEVVASVLVEEDGKILLYQSPKWGNTWGIPGGHVEPGETLEYSAQREIEEETGLKVEIKELIRFGELINDPNFHRPAHLIYFHYLAKKVSGNLTKNEEVKEFKWWDPKEALKLNYMPGTKETIEKYIKS